MARPLAFDRNRALDAAMRLFWIQGYANSSLQQLLDAMDIGRSSFYAAFGDKRSLFAEALARFAERNRNMVLAADESGGPVAAVRVFFETTLFNVPRRRMQRGCMLVNTVLETAGVEPDLRRAAADELAQIESDFLALFERARERGYRLDLEPEQLARFVMLMNEGLRVASRRNSSEQELRDTLETSLHLLSQSVHSPIPANAVGGQS